MPSTSHFIRHKICLLMLSLTLIPLSSCITNQSSSLTVPVPSGTFFPSTGTPTPFEFGVRLAKADLEAGILKYKIFGFPRLFDYPFAEIIESDYGFAIDCDGDVIFEKRENEIADGYNSVSVPAIEKEFGEDILYNVSIYAISVYSKGLSPEELEEQKEYLESYMEDLINRTVEP